MASRGFRGKEARIKFSADVSALERVKGVLGRLFSYIGNQSVIAAKKAQAIEQAMMKVAKSEAAWQRVVSEGISTAERRAVALARADEQITRAKERLTAITNKQLMLSGNQSVQALRSADRVAKAEESILRAKEQGLRISEKQAAQVRSLQKFQDNLDKAALRGSTREDRVAQRRDQAITNFHRLNERAADSQQRFASTSTRIGNTILAAENKLDQRKQALARLDADRQTESAREEERIASKRVNLAQQTSKLLQAFDLDKNKQKKGANSENSIARGVVSEKGLTSLITRLEGVRDKLKLAKEDISALEFDKQIAGAQHLLNLQKQYAKFTDETEAKRKSANNAVLQSERDLSSLQAQKQANEDRSVTSAQTYNARLGEQRKKVTQLNEELRKVKDNNAKAAQSGKDALAQLAKDYKTQIGALQRLQQSRIAAAARYANLSRAEQGNQKAAHAAEKERIATEIAQQNRKIDLVQKAYNVLKNLNLTRTQEQVKQEALAAQALAKEKGALDALIAAQQLASNAASEGSTKFLSSLSKIVSEIGAGNVALIALGAAGATAFSLANVQAFKLGIRLESLRATFTGLLGDIDQAQAVIDTSFNLAQTLPVSPDQLLESARTLISVGAAADKLSTDLRALAVVASVANQPMSELSVIYGEILTKNRVYREDVLQFSRRGIPLMQELSKITGKSRDELDKLVSLGAIKFDVFQAALRSLSSENSRYGAAVSLMAGSVSGKLTLLSNSWANLLKTTSETQDGLGINEAIGGSIDTLRSLTDALNRAAESMSKAAKEMPKVPLPLGFGGKIPSWLGGDRIPAWLGGQGPKAAKPEGGGPADDVDIDLPSVAELEARKDIIEDIDKYLQAALTKEEKEKLAIRETNAEFDRRREKLEALLDTEGNPQRILKFQNEIVQVERDRQTVLEQIALERGKEIRDMHEEAKLAAEIAGWVEAFKAGNGVKIPGQEGFSVIPEGAQEKVAAYLAQIDRLRAEANAAGRPFEFTNAEIQKQIALLNQLAELEAKPKKTPGEEKLDEVRADADEQEIVLDLLRQGKTLQEAQDEAAVQLLETKKEITAQQAAELRLQQKLAREDKNRIDILQEAKNIAEKVAPGKNLLDQFRGVNLAVENFGLGLADAEAIMQKMFIDALGLQSALNFKSQKIGLPDIGQHIQELALSQQNSQGTQFLKEIRDIVKQINDGEFGEDIIKAINDMARDIRKKAGVAG